ncbi:arginase family protein [Corallococcus macrosporus]|uniref:Agmatinase n=1 Tax=Myxococcus fulvus (strain ATCC BAA-855 / HW-1) TaxID=483219 RepID=F8CIW9_MYXFH|nr:arginase family protein [Corallococcus macrosporus]AEI67568.1 agmatinase [Corallococcus macrosporus]
MSGASPRASLFGWPDRSLALAEPGALCVVGAPTDLGNPIARGAAKGPAAIREASQLLAPPRVPGCDWGDVAGPANLARYLERLAETTKDILARGLRPLFLGGDHSISYAPVSVLQSAGDLCLVWIDAHTDFSPWEGTPFHDHKQVLRRLSKLPGVRRIVQIGYRGITVGDERSLGDDAVVITSARARNLSDAELLALVPEALPCYVSIDIDAVDPFHAPGTGAPVPDGLHPLHVRRILSALVRERRISGLDVVEVNPVLDVQTSTSAIAAELIREAADHWHSQLGRSNRAS